ncbi:hypothetical protein [Mesobacterium pallidum]|uniref:hypothetical protein n=1 Tax=Mesobacterium pallidum TaxID=2872037 RepID=UPI001EE17E52|nr:hypothetical protein [Mesobacterium pallidum]
MPSQVAAARTVLHYLETDAAPEGTAALAERLHAFLEQTGGATAAPRVSETGAVEIHCGPVLLTLRRIEGDAIGAAQSAFWGGPIRPSRIERDSRVVLQLAISVAASDKALRSDELAAPLLAGAACALARVARPAALQWLKPASWTTGAQFLEVLDDTHEAPVTLSPVTPRRLMPGLRARTARPAPAFDLSSLGRRSAPIEDEETLALRHARARIALTAPIEINVEAEAATASTSERLAAWSVSLSIAAFSLPVASSLAVYNLLRGEDLRHTAHAAALTGFMLVLGSTGAIAQVVGALGV